MSDVRDVSDADPDAEDAGTVLSGRDDGEPPLPDEGTGSVKRDSSGSVVRVERTNISEQERQRLLERTRGVR